jgi:signal transduction histidine kinase
MGEQVSVVSTPDEPGDLKDVLDEDLARVLLDAACSCGVDSASISLPDGTTFTSAGKFEAAGDRADVEILFKGRKLGLLTVGGVKDNEGRTCAVACSMERVLEAVMEMRYKLASTSESQARIMELAYDELLKANKRLVASEQKYRRLSESLEEEVRSRTRELREAHARLVQQQNMASVVRLASGLAHELNNPAGFVRANMNALRRYVDRIVKVAAGARALMNALPRHTPGLGEVERAWEDARLDFVVDDIHELVDQAIEGIDRIASVVSSLMGFSGVQEEYGEVNLKDKIESVLDILAPMLPEGTVVERVYEDEGVVFGSPGLIAQAFYQVLLNAGQSMPGGLRIVVSITRIGELVKVNIEDNGPGIPPEIRMRVFEPFFTTREVGRGAGLGLTIAYRCIGMNRGSIEMGSSENGGARVTVTFPAHRWDSD